MLSGGCGCGSAAKAVHLPTAPRSMWLARSPACGRRLHALRPSRTSRPRTQGPASAQAQAVPKPATAAQLARRGRSQERLHQKHLARGCGRLCASVRVASRLLAWLVRARSRHVFDRSISERRCAALDAFVERSASCLRRPAWEGQPQKDTLRKRPVLIGRLLVQQWPATRDDAGIARLAEARRRRPSRRLQGQQPPQLPLRR